MKNLCIVLALFSGFEFQQEELPSDLVKQDTSGFTFSQEELPQEFKSIAKPHFEFLSAPWCGGCEGVKQALERIGKENLPFTYRVRNVDSEGWLGANSIPAFAYQGKVVQYGFSTPENLMSRITKSATKPKTVQRLSASELREFVKTYRGGDVGVKGNNFWLHLQELPNHGFQAWQLQGLTQYELKRIHGAQHNGYLTPFKIISL